ncbi:MAG: hypothetical protein HC919_11895 [Oscillatoriales cyanobacterium SM2_2_1]|nr:hypothetical protein [Oscillatoriales cyanobacterium SM2_2_1]
MTTNKINLEQINVNPSGDGTFGFSNFAEIWNGRMAMIGFVAGLANEVITGKGILAQVGITGGRGALGRAISDWVHSRRDDWLLRHQIQQNRSNCR